MCALVQAVSGHHPNAKPEPFSRFASLGASRSSENTSSGGPRTRTNPILSEQQVDLLKQEIKKTPLQAFRLASRWSSEDPWLNEASLQRLCDVSGQCRKLPKPVDCDD